MSKYFNVQLDTRALGLGDYVSSVNFKTGTVSLDYSDVGAAPESHAMATHSDWASIKDSLDDAIDGKQQNLTVGTNGHITLTPSNGTTVITADQVYRVDFTSGGDTPTTIANAIAADMVIVAVWNDETRYPEVVGVEFTRYMDDDNEFITFGAITRSGNNVVACHVYWDSDVQIWCMEQVDIVKTATTSTVTAGGLNPVDSVAVINYVEQQAKIFFATYNSTSYTAIAEKVAAGVMPMTTIGSRLYFYNNIINGEIVFITAHESTIYWAKVNTSNVWTNSSASFELIGNKLKTTDTFTATDDNYASTAVMENRYQRVLTAGNNITINGQNISARDTTYTAGNNVQIDANNTISATDTRYTAGTNVTITNNQISAHDTVYTAGSGITINGTVISANGGGSGGITPLSIIIEGTPGTATTNYTNGDAVYQLSPVDDLVVNSTYTPNDVQTAWNSGVPVAMTATMDTDVYHFQLVGYNPYNGEFTFKTHSFSNDEIQELGIVMYHESNAWSFADLFYYYLPMQSFFEHWS